MEYRLDATVVPTCRWTSTLCAARPQNIARYLSPCNKFDTLFCLRAQMLRLHCISGIVSVCIVSESHYVAKWWTVLLRSRNITYAVWVGDCSLYDTQIPMPVVYETVTNSGRSRNCKGERRMLIHWESVIFDFVKWLSRTSRHPIIPMHQHRRHLLQMLITHYTRFIRNTTEKNVQPPPHQKSATCHEAHWSSCDVRL